MFLNEKNPVKVANRIVEENFSKQLNLSKQLFQRNAAQYHKKAVGELLVEEAENVDDANLGQRANAKNVASLDRSWYTIQGDLRHFIIYDCHDICSVAEAGKVLQGICGYQRAVIKGPVARKKS